MRFEELVHEASDAMTIRRVFGDPIERDGVTVIPVATLQGGAGGGSGTAPDGSGEGSGGGFGVSARPAGAFVIRDGDVEWRAVVDRNLALARATVVAVAALVTARALGRLRLKREALHARGLAATAA